VRIVPDVTVTSLPKPVRLFVELDRSTKALPRIAENLARYSSYLSRHYVDRFADGKEPWLVYIVRSKARQESIHRLMRSKLAGRFRAAALLVGRQSTEWLAEALLDERRGEERARGNAVVYQSNPLYGPSHRVLDATSQLMKGAPEIFDQLGERHTKLTAAWRSELKVLYEAVRDAVADAQ
jgi:hypothetical protein